MRLNLSIVSGYLTMNDKLEKLLEKAKDHKMTRRDEWLQRLSFIYGNLPESSTVTREQVEARMIEKFGPCPD